MSIMDIYGEFDIPEEKSTIEIIEDPAKIILACYDIFQRMKTEEYKAKTYPGWRCIYNLAVKSLEGREKLKPSAKDMERVFKNLKADSHNGFFVSAVHNILDLKTMVANFKDKIWTDQAGYRLREDKNLIILDSIMLGKGTEDSRGNIINYSQMLSTYLLSGLLINYGEIALIDFISGGIHINNNKMLNLYHSENITYINNGDGTRLCGGPLTGNVEKGMCFFRNKLFQSNQKLKDKLEEIEFLETLKDLPCEKQVEIIDKFDFEKFKTDVAQIVEKIYECHR